MPVTRSATNSVEKPTEPTLSNDSDSDAPEEVSTVRSKQKAVEQLKAEREQAER